MSTEEPYLFLRPQYFLYSLLLNVFDQFLIYCVPYHVMFYLWLKKYLVVMTVQSNYVICSMFVLSFIIYWIINYFYCICCTYYCWALEEKCMSKTDYKASNIVGILNTILLLDSQVHHHTVKINLFQWST